VFYNPRTRTRRRNPRKRIHNAIRASGLACRILPKEPRRHYAITLSENGAEMHVIQAMLGHHSVRTTEESMPTSLRITRPAGFCRCWRGGGKTVGGKREAGMSIPSAPNSRKIGKSLVLLVRPARLERATF